MKVTKVIDGVLGIALMAWSLPICFRVYESYVPHILIIVLGIIGFVAGFYLMWRCIRNEEGKK